MKKHTKGKTGLLVRVLRPLRVLLEENRSMYLMF
jgi:hypothetical protein